MLNFSRLAIKTQFYRQLGTFTVPAFITNIPQSQLTILPNGLKVVSEQRPGQVASVGVLISAGSALETRDNNGAGNLFAQLALEHKGGQFDNLGSQVNADVGRESLVFHSQIIGNQLASSVNLLGQLITDHTYNDETFASVVQRVSRSIAADKRSMDEQLDDHLHSVAFQNTPLGFTVAGPASQVANYDRKTVEKWQHQHVAANRVILAASGDVNHEKLVELAQTAFSKLPNQSEFDFASRPAITYTGSGVHIIDDDKHDIDTIIAAEAPAFDSADAFVVKVVATLLGNWTHTDLGGKNVSSRLGELAASESLAKSLSTFYKAYGDTGLLGYRAVTDSHHSQDFVCELVSEWVRLSNSATEPEVQWAKNKLNKLALQASANNTSNLRSMLSEVQYLGRRVPLAETYARADQVTVDDVRRVVKRYFTDISPAVVAHGNLEEYPDYELVRSWTYWNRL